MSSRKRIIGIRWNLATLHENDRCAVKKLGVNFIHQSSGDDRIIGLSYTFLYRRRSGYFYVLSSLAGRLTPEMTRTSTIKKSVVYTMRGKRAARFPAKPIAIVENFNQSRSQRSQISLSARAHSPSFPVDAPLPARTQLISSVGIGSPPQTGKHQGAWHRGPVEANREIEVAGEEGRSRIHSSIMD
jgi:hypothetical protein